MKPVASLRSRPVQQLALVLAYQKVMGTRTPERKRTAKGQGKQLRLEGIK